MLVNINHRDGFKRPASGLRADYSVDMLLINPVVMAQRDDGANVGTIGVPEDYLVRCINTGILSIATYLDARGYSVGILDFLESNDLGPLEDYLGRERPRVIGISCMTGFSYIQCLEIVETARRLAPDSVIVMGSQHVGPQAVAVLEDSPGLDAVALYEGEHVSARLIEVARGNDTFAAVPGIAWREGGQIHCNREYPPQVKLEDIPPLRYDLYPAFQTFQPYVEESRGCFAKCEFCITPFTNEYSIRGKSAKYMLYEIDRAAELWGPGFGTTRPLAMLASTFGVNLRQTLELTDGLGARGISWTSEFRADGALARHINRVADSGATALFVGVESASPTQILRMNKTTKPEVYLDSLRRLLREARSSAKLLLKLGFLIYIGETPRTLRETIGFLMEQGEHISWISVSPLFVFGGTPVDQRFPEYQRLYGASLHKEGFWGRSRTYACNVSSDFPFAESVEAARFLEKLFRRPEVFDKVFERKPAAEVHGGGLAPAGPPPAALA